jgi:AcrR family transcriptional regulator
MPRAGLSPSVVVESAARVADEVGLERLTLASVAQRLGVALPSLYKHVRGLDGLTRELALLGVRDLTAALTSATVGRSGRDALGALASAYRGYAKAHPGRYAAAQRGPAPGDAAHEAAAACAVEVMLAVLAGYGLGGDRAIHATRVLRSALHGFVSLELAGGFALPHSLDRSFEILVDTFDRVLHTWPPPRPRAG